MNSYWISSTEKMKKIQFNEIDQNYITDICVIGGGITGLSTAYYLSKKGLKVIVLDKSEIGTKTSGHTAAKITLNHGLIYNYLINTFGIDFASKYYLSNKQAISNIKNIIDTENIICDFEYQDNYIYTTNENNVFKLNNEIESINLIEDYLTKNTNFNLKNSSINPQFVKKCGLPFKISGAIKTSDQAQFHPVKYMYGLANSINSNGGLIFTNSLVTDIKKTDNEYEISVNNYKINAKYVVLASHYPFINFPGFYFSKMYQVTSYAIGIEINNNTLNGMYITDSEPTLSFRTTKLDNNKRLLIIGGGNHKCGFSPESKDVFGYKYLENEIKKYYPNSEILYKWNTRDCITLDKVPYIGEFSAFMPNTFVATGFNKWGMTMSNVSANIISDCILGKPNEFLDIYNSKRLHPIKNKEEVKNEVKQVFKSFLQNRIQIPKEDLSSIKNDNGGIIKIDGNSVGIYKDKLGNIYAINPTCTHLGCLLTWNNVDKTWDCPCHGSRFDYTGKNLYDPAFKDLEKYEM